MILKLKFILLFLLSLATFAMLTSQTLAANPDVFQGACTQAPDSTVCKQADQQAKKKNNPVTDIINKAANIIAAIAGIVAVVMIIISGFMFVTAGGAAPGQRSADPNRIKKARATLTSSIIGLVVVALAWTITRFIIDRVIQ